MDSDVGEKPVSLPSLVKIREELMKLIEDNTRAQLLEVLSDISENYGIARNELVQKYLTVQTKSGIKSISDLCIAKVASGKQCSRRHREDSVFCGSHVDTQPFGVVSTDSTPATTRVVIKTKIKTVE
jgi:hypothetical protein